MCLLGVALALLARYVQSQALAGHDHFRAFGMLGDPRLGALADRVERVVVAIRIVMK
jgi:hypothetical protein